MGNCHSRFFCRYKEAEKDYYDTFRWLVRLNMKYPKYTIGIKHHPHYTNKDIKELLITKCSPIIYIDNDINSYILASQAKMVVAYFTTMILELNGYPNLSHWISEKRRNKRFNIYLPKEKLLYPLAFFLDPEHRNRHFCKEMDERNKFNCENCKGQDLEIFEPYRLTTYEQFETKVKEIIKWL
jgi:hypothetical protein